jgi:hypothetical protein
MSKARDDYYDIFNLEVGNELADRAKKGHKYIKELEEKNEEMLDLLLEKCECINCQPLYIKQFCNIIDCSSFNKKEVIEKATGKSIEEVLNENK